MGEKKVLVTGGQGFLGSYICSDLLDNGYSVVSIDNFSKYGVVKRQHDSHRNFTLIQDDVINTPNAPELKDQDFDFIIAGAAKIGGIRYFHKYTYDILATNERILASTFDFAINRWRDNRLKRILVISSSMVFESTNVYPTPESEIKLCPPPASTYGFQKLASEYFCKGAYDQYGLPYTIARPFNCIGVGENEAVEEELVSHGNIKMMMSHVVPDLIYKVFMVGRDGPLPILGDGQQVRHYTYGGDIARGIRLAMESEQAVNEDFNISSPVPTSVRELASMIWDKIWGPSRLSLKHLEPLSYDVQMRSPDTTKAKELLGFEYEVSLSEALDQVIEWVSNYYNFKR